jgi:hypothetical protein
MRRISSSLGWCYLFFQSEAYSLPSVHKAA